MTKRYKNNSDPSAYDEDWDNTGYVNSEARKRFRRNKIDGVLGGVCAGLGDYFNIDPVIVRIFAVISFFMSGGVTFWVYVGLWIFIPSDKRAPYRREYRQARHARRRHKQTPEAPARPTTNFRDVKGKFSSLEMRLQDLERSITSSEWQLRRDFRDLES